MITTTEQKFLNNFTTMANVINHIDEDGILKVERKEGDLVVMSAEKFDQICEEAISILAMLLSHQKKHLVQWTLCSILMGPNLQATHL